MSHYRIIPEQAEPDKPYNGQLVACPGCGSSFVFCRSEYAAIDACGFESYAFSCEECGASLSGIIDPLDETLLLTKTAA